MFEQAKGGERLHFRHDLVAADGDEEVRPRLDTEVWLSGESIATLIQVAREARLGGGGNDLWRVHTNDRKARPWGIHREQRSRFPNSAPLGRSRGSTRARLVSMCEWPRLPLGSQSRS